MLRRIILLFLIIIIVGANFIIVEAGSIEKVDVHLDPDDFVGDSLTGASKSDIVSLKIVSDNPVDVYVMTNEDYRDDVIGPVPDYKYAKYSELGVTSTTFTFTIPDDELYVLVISNPHNETAIVDYMITYPESKSSDDNGLGGCICVSLIIIAVLILLYYFFWFRKGKKFPIQLRQQPQYMPPVVQEPPPAPPPPLEPEPEQEPPRARSVDEAEQEPPPPLQ